MLRYEVFSIRTGPAQYTRKITGTEETHSAHVRLLYTPNSLVHAQNKSHSSVPGDREHLVFKPFGFEDINLAENLFKIKSASNVFIYSVPRNVGMTSQNIDQ